MDNKEVEKTIEQTYLPPAVPISPVLSFASLGWLKQPASPSILDVEQSIKFTSGRMAIAAAVKHMGLVRGDKVLVPAYHCPSMIDPFVWASAEPVFYHINEDLSVDLDDILSRLDKQTRCLLVVHYFGFYQDMKLIREFCDKHNLLLLEDCAHTFFGECAGRPVGSFGDYAIASSIKFFPIYDGGLLASSTRDLGNIKQVSAGIGFQIKAVISPIEKAVGYGRFQPFNIFLKFGFSALNMAWKSVKKLSSRDLVHAAPDAMHGGFDFNPAWLKVKMSWLSRMLMARVSTNRLVNRRRENYTRISEALREESGCTVLFPELDPSVVPYIFPLVVENYKRVFHDLKTQQVPIYRWEDISKIDCDVSQRYSKQLLQIPCHQELSTNEIDWIILKLKQSLARFSD